MARIVVYDPDDVTVANRVIEYHESAHTPDFYSESNKLVNPSLASVTDVDQKYWKVVGSALAEMNSTEKEAVDELTSWTSEFEAHDSDPVSTTKSSAYKTIEGMEFTPKSGHFKVDFSGTWEGSSRQEDYYIGIFVAGVLVGNSYRNYKTGKAHTTTEIRACHTMALVDTDGTEVIEVKFKVGSGTMKVHDRHMIVERA